MPEARSSDHWTCMETFPSRSTQSEDPPWLRVYTR
jgi:hypothetical protein